MELEDVAPNLFFLMAAAHETTASLIANTCLLLLDPTHAVGHNCADHNYIGRRYIGHNYY